MTACRLPGTRAARFAACESGFVLVFFAVCVPALLGLVGLAIDGARLMTLDTQLAAAADAQALAAANRLDRSANAIPAARAAAEALGNRPGLAERRPAGSRSSYRFAATLYDLQRNPTLSLGDQASESAVYVEATTAEASLTTSFFQLVGATSLPIRHRAVAESQYYACDVTPMVLCQPDPSAFAATATPGRQYLLRYNGAKTPGSIALLDRADDTDGRQTLRNLASNAPPFCYGEGVRLRTNFAPVAYDDALDVRFDRYQGRAGPVAPDLAVYPPAPIVITGRHLDTCRSSPEGGSILPPFPLPRDVAYQDFRLAGAWDAGGGDWKSAPPVGLTEAGGATALEEYLGWNHADKPPDLKDRLRNAPTRYALYLAELGLTSRTETKPVDTRSYGASTATIPTGGPADSPVKESPVPVCYAGNQPAVEARRRIVYMTIADCADFPTAATAANLSRHVGKFFLTEPSDLGATLVEFVNLVRPTDDDGKLRHVVQLVTVD